MSSNARKDYRGYENDVYEVIDDTGKTRQNQQVVLVLNKLKQRFEELPIQRVKSGRATGRTVRESKSESLNHPGVYLWEGQWTARITINGKGFHLGRFDKLDDAQSAYSNALNNWLDRGALPNPVKSHPRATNSTGELYIQYRQKRMPKPWVFEKVTDGKRITRYFSTLDDAIAFKQQYLGGTN